MYLEVEEITRFFAVITSKRDRAIFRLAYHRGLRAHEVGILQMSDYRQRDGVLYVRRGKGSVSREHTLLPIELKELRAWIKLRGTYPGPLFPSRVKKMTLGISRYRLHQLMRSYCKKAGIRREKAHMHVLKHSCGTHLRDRGNGADVIQDWLGHRDPQSSQVYMHFTRRFRKDSYEKNKDWR